MKIRERIRALVWHRLEIMGPAREAVRSALAILAMPQNVPLALALSLAQRRSDVAAGRRHQHRLQSLHQADDPRRGLRLDLLAWLDDESEGWTETAAFLDRRIDNVMQFEKLKAEWRGIGRPAGSA